MLMDVERAFRRMLNRAAAALALVLAGVLGTAGLPAFGHGTAEESAHQHMVTDAAARSTADYAIPPINLVRADGHSVWLADEINDGRPVVLDFIYTTCTSICPMSSQTLSDVQKKLGAGRSAVHLVSISIDPENDTPVRLREYAKKFGAGPDWQFYTSTLAASTAAQKAFNVYRGDKMSHTPVTLVRTAPGKTWIRIDGFATADQLLGELRDSVALAGEQHVH